MSTKETTITTESDDAGNEIVTEIDTTITQTSADGTETVAEITTTQGDEPGEIEGHVMVTETAPDGTETVYEVTTTQNADGTVTVEEENESLLEEVVEALFDTDGDQDDVEETDDTDDTVDTEVEFEEVENVDSLEMGDVEVVPASMDVAAFESPVETVDTSFIATPEVETLSESTEDTAAAEAEAAEIAEQEAHVEAAKDAQSTADEFIDQGDYAAAAEAREAAETEAGEAGDSSMLSAYDSSDLASAAEKQEDAQYYEAQEAQLAQEGDYEGAREAADNAGYAVTDADSAAGGADHSGQADGEKYNMDWAVHEEKQADYYAENAAAYAADGDFENAERSADQAEDHQARADDFGDQGEHGSIMADYDPSSEVASGAEYDSTYDSTDVDTGFDAGVDTSVDTSVADTSYDAGTTDV